MKVHRLLRYWDQIDATSYKLYSSLNKLIPKLKENSENRTEKDIEFQFLREDIEKNII